MKTLSFHLWHFTYGICLMGIWQDVGSQILRPHEIHQLSRALR